MVEGCFYFFLMFFNSVVNAGTDILADIDHADISGWLYCKMIYVGKKQ